MLSNQQLIDLIVSEPSWEDVIIRIVAEEEMDPWSIDIVKLADVFTAYLNKMHETDLRVPARFILITAILLRMKSDILSPKKRILIPESPENPKESELLRKLANIPPLQPPIRRIPLKNVTINELVSALRKAFEVKERRVRRRHKARRRVQDIILEEEDITDRINNLLNQIRSIMDELEQENVEFSKIVKDWKRKEIVNSLVPLLHLAQDGKLSLSQEELFKEILIKLKDDTNEHSTNG